MPRIKLSAGACAVMFAAAVVMPASAAPEKAAAHTHLAAHTTVLPLSEGPHLLGSGASGYWTPQAADLRRLEADMPRSIADYYRQYMGIVKDGKHLIYISGFNAVVASEYARSKFDWKHHAVFVDDGGTDFFEATYDPKTRKFSGPKFHGLG